MGVRSIGIAVMLAAAAAGAGAQQAAAPTVTVSAQGVSKVAPDTAVVTLDIRAQDGKLRNAYDKTQTQADQVRALLQQQGFNPADAHWSGYQVFPINGENGKVSSYEVATEAELDVTNFEKIGPLVDAAGAAGLGALRGVRFELKNPAAAKQAAIADGYHSARAEAEALARAAGERLGGLAHASVDSSETRAPGPLLLSSQMELRQAPMQQFTPQLITVTANVSLEYRIGQ